MPQSGPGKAQTIPTTAPGILPMTDLIGEAVTEVRVGEVGEGGGTTPTRNTARH